MPNNNNIRRVDYPNVNWVEFDVARYWPRWLMRCVQSKGCWLWQGYCVKGYPQSNVHGHQRLLHRLAYMSVFGPIPDGKELDHRCDESRCINPFHLDVRTGRQNTLRSTLNACAVNFRKIVCKRGHPLDLVRKNGSRLCSVCSRESKRKYKRKIALEKRAQQEKLL